MTKLKPFFFTTFFLLIIVNSSWTQTIEVVKGEQTNDNYFIDYFGSDNQYIYTYNLANTKGKITSIEVKKFNQKLLNLDTVTKLTLSSFKNDFPSFLDIKLINNKYHVFATLFHRLNNDYKLILYQFNLNGNLIHQPEELTTKFVENHRVSGKYKIADSEVKNVFLITYQNLLNKKFSKSIGLTLVNLNDEKINVSDTLISSSYINKNINILKALYSKDSTIHLLTNTNTSKNSNSYSSLNHKYTFFSFYLKDKMLKEFPINIGANWINSATFILNKDLNPIISGFYSTSRRYAFVGSFFISINNKEKSILDVNMKKLDENLFSDKQKQRKNKEIKEIYFEKMYQDSTGYYSICQESYIDVNSYVDPQTRSVSYDYYYYYLDIVLIKFDLDGNYLYEKKYPKSQITINDEGIYSSYISIMRDHELFFIYNDHTDNINESTNKSMSQPKNSQAVIEKFDINNGESKEILVQNKQEKRIIIPSSYYILPNNDIIVTTEKLNNTGLVKIKIK